MGCGCGTGSAAKTLNASVQTYSISDDPDNVPYLTERDAMDARTARNLSGEIVPTK
ncbi:MAG: hypothetical protein LC792_15480 [Actinobacteria bacterium]|nr:hypothetical protein [Actinomycetota bacterium]